MAYALLGALKERTGGRKPARQFRLFRSDPILLPVSFYDLPQPFHNFRSLAGVELGVHLGDGWRVMTQDRARRVQAGLPANLRRLRVPELVRMPVRDHDLVDG